jgi:excinuclease ABC subunit B
MRAFRASDLYAPMGDQARAIEEIASSVTDGNRFQTILGATGTGKTATMAWTIEKLQRPALVIAHNKTLAAQLCNEFREFFPENAVEYFVSYYDYYQPEAYVPQADLYIEKDSSQNDDIARLRLSATSSLLTRRDVVVVASVSCIYGLGSPEEWRERVLILETGQEFDRDEVLRKLIESQYVRNDTVLGRGRFRVKGDVVEIQPANIETAYRVSFFGDEVEQITHFDPLTGEVYARLDNLVIWPATEYVTSKPTIERAVDELRAELEEQVSLFESQGRMLEAHRIRQRTEYDLEMMKELGFCSGIENYSRVLEGRPPGSHPFTLIDYFPDDLVVFVDESHQTVPQLGGMYEGDRSRKQTLVEYGFRLPSALDNRPLRFDEFLGKVPQLVFVSATPGAFELSRSKVVAEQLIRPTGVVDPEVELRPTKNQIDDLLNEIRRREEVNERTLVTTLTKKMAEDLTDYLLEAGVRARYLHSEIDTLDRIAIIRELRLGEYDVLVGVNLLREGLDLPEVSLVAVLDADKEGFLRGKTALIQTTGRAARNVNGKVLLYADKRTEAIIGAMEETNRRRAYQIAYNEEHGIVPETIVKGVSDIAELLSLESPHVPRSRRRRGKAEVEGMSPDELEKLVVTLEEEMYLAAEELRFEYAAKLRDEVKELRRELNALVEIPSGR